MFRFRLRDLLILLVIVAMLGAVLLMTIGRRRSIARVSLCASRLTQVGLAVGRYHGTHDRFPPAMYRESPHVDRLSGLIPLLPGIGEQALWERIAQDQQLQQIPALGQDSAALDYPPWQATIENLLCPTSTRLTQEEAISVGQTNFTFCIGDAGSNLHRDKPLSQTRGIFSPYVVTRFADVADGLSNTICMLELANAQRRDRRGQFVIAAPPEVLASPVVCRDTLNASARWQYDDAHRLSSLGRGGIWADGAAGHALGNTILPPNDPSCGLTDTPADGIFSASSYHAGGAHVLFADGRVEFVTATIDTGDLTAPPPDRVLDDQGEPIPSPYGVWGELGTRAGSVAPPVN